MNNEDSCLHDSEKRDVASLRDVVAITLPTGKAALVQVTHKKHTTNNYN
jgi:hypothetical protein